jgi:hypothetical protein
LLVLPAAAAEATSLNAFRAANGRAPLSVSPALTAMAQSHASSMARRSSLDHSGFMQHRGPSGATAENVAWGCADTACVIRQWSNSPGHRANMLRSDVRHYGLASATTASGRRYWTLLVGGGEGAVSAGRARFSGRLMMRRTPTGHRRARDLDLILYEKHLPSGH